jgi:hypothetical protein
LCTLARDIAAGVVAERELQARASTRPKTTTPPG